MRSLVVRRHFPGGAYLCREHENDPTLHFIVEGEISILLRIDNERTGRMATLSAGDAVGEASLVVDSNRSADVARAVATKLIRNIAVELSTKLRRANQQIRSLTR